MIATQLLWALALILVTLTVQGIVLDLFLTRLPGFARSFSQMIGAGWRMFFYAVVMMILALPHMAAIIIWALFYMFIAAGDEIIPLETALYFSGSAYSTVGFGDITMSADWRFISTLEALNGLLLLAGSVAALVEMSARLYRNLPARPAAPAKTRTKPAAKPTQK